MAIAYFIPDQAQLLARSRQQSAAAAATAATDGSNSSTNHRQNGSRQQQQQQHQHQPQRGSNTQFRANISVPLGSEQGAMSMSEFGCWELLAQIFCYALRLYSYNPAQRRPTVIQISFEISSGTSDADTNTEDAVGGEDGVGDVTDATGKRD